MPLVLSGSDQEGRNDAVVEVQIFVSTDCPVANSYAPLINRIDEIYGPRGVQVTLVYPDTSLTDADVARHVSEFDLSPSTTIDRDHSLVRRAGATITPEVAVFDKTGALVYRGRIDNRYTDFGDRRAKATERG